VGSRFSEEIMEKTTQDLVTREATVAETLPAPTPVPGEPVLLDVAARGGGDRPVARAAKRAFDLVFSILALTLLAPVFLLIALAIKLDSPGPVLFRSSRAGRGGKPFGMLKFRTMIEGADNRLVELHTLNDAGAGVFKIRQDPRVTRTGRFLRSISFDELPQLIHVLTGEMSVVGPRPLPLYSEALINGGSRELPMRPGITGLWQVSGRPLIPLEERVAIEEEYMRSWTLFGDAVVLFKTITHVLGRRGL
jgi:lipopolysaccharide/colanic/teichoic acid biosynthesis glycosyltransferase